MRILFINDLYPPYIKGGGEISTHLLAKGLAHIKGFEVKVLTMGPEEKQYFFDGVNVQAIESQNIYWSYDSDSQNIINKSIWHLQTPYLINLTTKITDVIRDFDPDIIETSVIENFSDKLWRLIKKENKKIIHILRSYSQICYNANMFKNGMNCKKQCYSCKIHSYVKKRLSQNVDTVIGISQYILDRHISNGYFKNAKKFVIPNIYDGAMRISEKNENEVVLGYIGRIHPTKGVEVLIDAFKKVFSLKSLNNNIEIKLIIAGTGEPLYTEKLKILSRNYPIKFIGFIEPKNFYSMIDISVCPSIWEEPFGRVIIESMAHGIPVIGAKAGGIPELIVDTDDTGLLFQSGSASDLSQKILHIVSNKSLLKILGKNCLKKSKEFSTESILNQHINVIEKTIDDSQ